MTPHKRVTLRQIAQRAGVSTGTVSMVLNHSPLVADTTREHVQSIIREIGYVYDRSAAQLRNKRSNIVGASICDLRNPYFAEVAAGIEASLDELGQVLFLGNSVESVARQAHFLETLREYNVEGVLLMPAIGTRKADVERLFEWRVPVVMVSRYIRGVTADYAGSDNRLAAALATHHLIGLGHRRIAFVGVNKRTTTGQDRVAGYGKALRAAALPMSPELLVECEAFREAGFAAVQSLMRLACRPTAVVCFNDLLAFGVMLGLRHLGLEAGRDCSVVGIDDVVEAALWMPPLTTVAIDVTGIGRAAGRVLLQRIAAPNAAVQRVVLPPRLVVRSSCGPVPTTRAGKRWPVRGSA
jgi:LacI family transcriptional regulator